MGIYNRDYLRDEHGSRGGGGWAGGGGGAIKWLIIINTAVFVVQVVTQQRTSFIDDWLTLDRSAIFGGQVWRLLTYEFLHDPWDVWHLVFNMLFLFFAGRKVESYYGSREFVLLYLAAGVLSGLFSVFWYELMGPANWSAIGASGAVAAIFVVYALNWPHDIWRIMFVLPVPAFVLAIGYAIYDVFPMLQQIGGRTEGLDRVAHSAHVGGMLFALAYQRRNWRLEPWLEGLRTVDWKRRMRARTTKLRVYEPEQPVDFERRVDELLAKVAEQGEASLSPAERAELVAAGRRYRDRSR